MRGFDGEETARELGIWPGWGVLMDAAGDALGLFKEPNCMPLPPACFPPTGPPLAVWPLAPAALMVTEGLRPWSPCEIELIAWLPLTIVGPPNAGTAGGMAPLPVTESDLLCAELPTADRFVAFA
jgi:hypothetical protein